jgi:hypothetical protein
MQQRPDPRVSQRHIPSTAASVPATHTTRRGHTFEQTSDQLADTNSLAAPQLLLVIDGVSRLVGGVGFGVVVVGGR